MQKSRRIKRPDHKDRRYLHQHPELSYKEKNTTAYLVASLKELGIPVQTFEDYTGCIVTIKGGKPGKHTVLLRGDIDALPIKENSGVEFESENEGVMQPAGHDCHTSMLLEQPDCYGRKEKIFLEL